MSEDERFMRRALDACRQGIDAGQSPFGACIVRGGQVVACAHNRVWRDLDPSAHAEVQAIRLACGHLGTVHLPGATIYSTTEPCPMCYSAIHWTRLARIVFAARVEDAVRFGFNELNVTNAAMNQLSGATIEITADFLRDEALELYAHWKGRGGKAY